jgi:hypothetical protein
MKIWLDDVRIPPGPDWTISIVAWECIHLLDVFRDSIFLVSLDHDLGDDENGTGQTVLDWMERTVHNDPTYAPPEIIRIHTSNPIARIRMEQTVQSIRRLEATRNAP